MIEDPKWRSRAFAIEYWMLTILVAGALLASIVGIIKSRSNERQRASGLTHPPLPLRGSYLYR